MTAAHYLCLMRLPLLLLATVFLVHDFDYARSGAALAIFGAILTDALDGYVARRQGTVSDFGATLDSTLDKVFVCPCLYLIAGDNPWLLWFAVVITAREFLVMGVRIRSSTDGDVLPARLLGKAKVCCLYAGMLMVLFQIVGGTAVLGLATVLSVVSAGEYVFARWSVLRSDLFPVCPR